MQQVRWAEAAGGTPLHAALSADADGGQTGAGGSVRLVPGVQRRDALTVAFDSDNMAAQINLLSVFSIWRRRRTDSGAGFLPASHVFPIENPSSTLSLLDNRLR